MRKYYDIGVRVGFTRANAPVVRASSLGPVRTPNVFTTPANLNLGPARLSALGTPQGGFPTFPVAAPPPGVAAPGDPGQPGGDPSQPDPGDPFNFGDPFDFGTDPELVDNRKVYDPTTESFYSTQARQVYDPDTDSFTPEVLANPHNQWGF